MFHLNQVSLIGNLGDDAEVRAMADGATLFKVRLCTDKEWHSVDYYATTEKEAKFLAEVLVKGALIYAFGAIQTDTWTDKAGAKRTWKKIRAKSISPVSVPVREETWVESGVPADFNPDIPHGAPAPTPAPTEPARNTPPPPSPPQQQGGHQGGGLRDRFRNLGR